MKLSAVYTTVLSLVSAALSVAAYDASVNDNLVVYWGQNSYGATHTDKENWQKNIASYCDDDAIDVLPMGFLNVFFSTGGLPEVNLANSCNNIDNPVFEGSTLANCDFLADEIKTCQDKGKLVTLSLGGATGGAVFTDDAQAESFAQTLWDLFFEGSSGTRPFGDAVLDGIDLDIEGGTATGWVALVKKFQSLASGGSKKYYVTAAPQCPYPDAYMGATLNGAEFDAVYIQFYNNACGLLAYGTDAFNYAQWDEWATTVSLNKDVKLFVGGLASETAGTSGYVIPDVVIAAAKDLQQYSSFGGVMLWDASQAYANSRFDQAIKAGISGTTVRANNSAPVQGTEDGELDKSGVAPVKKERDSTKSMVSRIASRLFRNI